METTPFSYANISALIVQNEIKTLNELSEHIAMSKDKIYSLIKLNDGPISIDDNENILVYHLRKEDENILYDIKFNKYARSLDEIIAILAQNLGRIQKYLLLSQYSIREISLIEQAYSKFLSEFMRYRKNLKKPLFWRSITKNRSVDLKVRLSTILDEYEIEYHL